MKKKEVSRQRAYQIRHYEAGLCVLCPNERCAESKRHCRKHALKLRSPESLRSRKAAAKERYLQQRARGLCGYSLCEHRSKGFYCRAHREQVNARAKERAARKV